VTSERQGNDPSRSCLDPVQPPNHYVVVPFSLEDDRKVLAGFCLSLVNGLSTIDNGAVPGQPNPIHTSMLHAFSAAGVLSSPGPGWFRRSSIKGPGLGPQQKAQVMVHGSRMTGDAVGTVGTAPKTNKRRNMPARDQDMAWIKG
jgi:hypothetical protein